MEPLWIFNQTVMKKSLFQKKVLQQGKAPKGASNNEAAATMSTPGQFDVPKHLKPDFIRNHVPFLGTRPPRRSPLTHSMVPQA